MFWEYERPAHQLFINFKHDYYSILTQRSGQAEGQKCLPITPPLPAPWKKLSISKVAIVTNKNNRYANS
jgi:hypothetical protein